MEGGKTPVRVSESETGASQEGETPEASLDQSGISRPGASP